MDAIKHHFIQTNGIRMHVAEQGEGPLVVLCHGFPESWYSWRHQLAALAKAGFRGVAPDQRGYGQTDRPEAIEAYDLLRLTSDIVGLVHALGEEKAVVIGHDWGAPVAAHCALLRPDIFHAVALLSVPHFSGSWNDSRPTLAMKEVFADKEFYQLYFQEPGKAEQELEADVERTLRLFLYSAHGQKPLRLIYKKTEKLLDTGAIPPTLPDWLTEEDIAFYVKEFERTGFRGGLNWYRNIDRRWKTLSFLIGAKIQQPSLFIAGEKDGVIAWMRKSYDRLEEAMPHLRKKILLEGAGHWIQQEKAEEVNALLIEFLDGLDRG